MRALVIARPRRYRGREMRRRARWLASTALLVGVSAGLASAASPVPGRRFGGSGGDYMNNAPHWVRKARGSFHFTVSATGKRMLSFYGTYSYYCGGGSSYLSAKYLIVARNGTFNYAFKGHTAYGTTFAWIWGSFTGHGNTAHINYLADFVANGRHVAHPYDVSHPRALGCASWVRGTARAS